MYVLVHPAAKKAGKPGKTRFPGKISSGPMVFCPAVGADAHIGPIYRDFAFPRRGDLYGRPRSPAMDDCYPSRAKRAAPRAPLSWARSETISSTPSSRWMASTTPRFLDTPPVII